LPQKDQGCDLESTGASGFEIYGSEPYFTGWTCVFGEEQKRETLTLARAAANSSGLNEM
jgi:hypothetical protein